MFENIFLLFLFSALLLLLQKDMFLYTRHISAFKRLFDDKIYFLIITVYSSSQCTNCIEICLCYMYVVYLQDMFIICE